MNLSTNRIVYNEKDKTAEVFIYDTIGPSDWGYVGAKNFVSALREAGDIKAIDVRINSGGGDVFEANAIYNGLKEHKARVHVHIDGIAASAASFVAMAGDRINMAENAMFMIHNASTIEWGTASDMVKTATRLEQIDQSIAKVYSDRISMPIEDVKKLMDEETWMTAKDAKKHGFVDVISPNKSVAACADLTKFKNCPDWAQTLLNKKEVEVEMATKTEEKPVEKVNEKPVETTVENTPVENKIDLAEVRAEAVEKERKRVSSINALCAKAKCPDLAERFINEGLSMDDVNRKLLERLIADNVPIGDGGNTAIENKKTEDPKAKYKAEFLEFKNMHDRLGVTEEMYVKSRELEESRK